MAVAKISKAEFYIHKSELDGVLQALQDTGSFEVIAASSEEDLEKPAITHHDSSRVDFLLSEARFILRFLEPHYSDPTSNIARLFGEKDEITLGEARELDAQSNIASVAEEIRGLERRLIEIRSEISQIDGTEALLLSLKDFPFPMELLSSGTEHLRGILGSLPAGEVESWKEEALSLLGTLGEYYVVPGDEKDKDRIVAIFFEKTLASEVGELNAKHSLNRIDVLPSLKSSVKDEGDLLKQRKTLLEQEEKSIMEKAVSAAAAWVPRVRVLSDYYGILHDRYGALLAGDSTEQVIMLRGWIPNSDIPAVKKALSSFDSSIELVVSEPEEGDDVPSCMVNSSWCLPFENLTRLYGAPKVGEIDPTPLLAPFFFVFFGMCLGDAGYGLIMIGFFSWFLKRYKKMPDGIQEFFKLFVLSGVATVIVGALTGSWFGDLIDAYEIFAFLRPLKNAPVLLNPMENPMVFLAISLALGVFQLLFGLLIAFYDAIRKKDYMAAFADIGGWLVFLVGLLILGGFSADLVSQTVGSLGKTLSITGAVVLVATQGREKSGLISKAISGILSLYDATSYLGDVLSYSRLLALGLATSAVGVIINMLAGLAGGVPFIGWILALVLILGGHVFSIAVNVLGAFVHSLRLQYVEFFSKFYSGGGRIFSPLTYKTHYVAIKED